MKNVLVYSKDHESLGSITFEVIPQGYGPTLVKTFINGQFVGKSGFDDATLARELKGATLVERKVV